MRELEEGVGERSTEKPVVAAVDELILKYKLNSFSPLDAPVTILKFGGSIFRMDDWQEHVNRLCDLLLQLYKENSIIVTTGGGLSQKVVKDMKDGLQTSERVYENSAGRALETQAETIADRLGPVGKYYAPDDLHYITTGTLKDQIPVVSMMDQRYIEFAEILDKEGNIQRVNCIPKDQSDAHTIAITNYFVQDKVVFGKNTEGVFLRDPNISNGAMHKIYGFIEKRFGKKIKENPFYPEIYASEILRGTISRLGGDEREDHLAEDLSLRYFLDPTNPVKLIQVVNGTKPEYIKSAIKGNLTVGSQILKG